MDGCKAYYSGGQMVCDHCGLVWDRDDDDPPDCKLEINIVVQDNFSEPLNKVIETIEQMVDGEPVKLGGHDKEMQKIKEVLSDESNGS